MKKFSEKSRKGLRKLFLILGVSAVSLLFQACYGCLMDTLDWENEYFTTEEESSNQNSEKTGE
jgi:hypothetical protein